MKKSKLLMGTLAFSMMGAMIMSPIHAAAVTNTGLGDTDVSYTSESNIPDPDNPQDPKWAVSVPSAIVFTSSNKTADATVQLKSMNGYSLPTAGTITVSVKSKNGYGLQAAGTDKDIMPYSLKYGTTSMTSAQTEVGNMVLNPIIAGEAKLDANATAKVKGSHTDTLTYTVVTNDVTY